MRAFLLFLLLLLLFPALGLAIGWWQDGQAPEAWWQWALLLALPLLVWFWLRHYSILGCNRCLPPERRG